MKYQIEQEIDRTLDCLNQSDTIQVSSLFIDAVNSKVSHLHTRRGIGYRSRAFYPVVVLLMIMLNAAAMMGYFGKQQSAGDESYDQVAIVASEYGIGQSSYSTF